MKSISVDIGLDKSRRPYVETILGSCARAGEDDVRVMAEPFEHALIAPEQVRLRSIAELFRE
jgi:hypothetical protein